MAHTVITFLGVKPRETQYEYQGKYYPGQVFAEAMLKFWDFNRMLVFTTEEAKKTSWPILQAYNDPRIQEVPIPTGKDESEIWQIFDAVIQNVEEGEEVTFDITHGLRSIPFLVFLFAAYLRSAKRVKIRAILYGAFELGKSDERGQIVGAPVIDLSKFASMLEWINATDQFIQTGSAYRLAALLEEVKQQKEAAKALKIVSQAALLCQPLTLMEKATELGPALQQAAGSFSTTSRPFTVLSNLVLKTFNQFGLKNPTANPPNFLRREWALIEWYREHGQLIQALTLAREFLIDFVNYKLKNEVNLTLRERRTMERAVSGLAQLWVNQKRQNNANDRDLDESSDAQILAPDDLNFYGRQIYDQWANWESIAELYSELSQVRNQLNHAEHQAGAMKLRKIEQKARDVLEQLSHLLAQI
ncbi:TIGR02221 family CRISPR-associated protein [uncultured Thermanaerothrix sp.]|uniref:TIGR02221 family CRISPR-associated protein n=1 Tax=uncultured Thermanaerothrix sp. TaxID=1195149 RepID=UPI002623887F|nr:TIGR02221 family CRISPR-associated protein [uncultured Thermanaerothrix sp.]